MNKKLVLIAVTMLGVLGATVSEAKVCRLGDADCGISEFYGTGSLSCSSEYITCDMPRLGATYCKEDDGSGNVVTKYDPKDCCSRLKDQGYEECTDKWEVGRGDSCRTFDSTGAAVTYWEQCGCQYGFAETDAEGNLYRNDENRTQECGTYTDSDRCMGVDVGSDRCKFVNCNISRRFVSESRSYCKYRLDTSCGALGCRQVYDCDNEAEYYRNDSEYLSESNKNFIDYRGSDISSNELDASGNLLPSTSYNDDCSVNTQAYNIVNRYVCNYLQGDGNETQSQEKGIKDVELGFDCGEGVPNYCYLWKGCNNTRHWFNSDLNVGVLYNENLYPKWFSVVESASGYDYNGLYPIINPKHDEFLKLSDVNPNYDKYEPIEPGYDEDGNPVFSYNGKSLSICNNNELDVGEGGSTGDIYTSDLNGNTICYIVNKDNGCAYIRKDCHQDDNGHRCWKKIGCANENRFYSSFINAALTGYIDGSAELSDNDWYETSVNTSFYFDVFYSGLEAKEIYPACLYRMNNCNDNSGCFRKEGCAEGFEDIRDHTEIETDWETWFEDIRPICNDSTRCYKAISCTLDTGAYSSVPNTSFFTTINSLATGLICYKGIECNIDSGSYTSTPNTSFFTTIHSLASSSTCYRGQECHIASGAYTSSPNTYFFGIQESVSSGSTCYRGTYCLGLDEGAYTSSPNTSFFEIISSHASSSSCFRGQNCSLSVGAYTSTPNTSFFITINSLSSGSTCYRGQECHITAGAYTSTPNTLFFEVQESLSSGSTCYRGMKCRFETGIYTSSPNTSFFLILNSHASGSNCYRTEGCHYAAGAYDNAPNTSFFVTIHSLSTNSYCYRGQECYIDGGSYSSTPNTSFFVVIDSLSSGSTCYRGQECYIDGGAYTSTPNEYFFYVQESLSSGSTCYRGVSCSGLNGGAYTSTPNTSFFEVIYSLASGSSCYRGQNCSPDSGAYTSTPNTSFFVIISSLSSGSSCYRGQECHIDSGSYSSSPNTSFFVTIHSLASSSTCYRGQECHIDGGAYTSTPNTVFFDVINSLSSASTCYRGGNCAATANDFENTSFFNMVFSLSSGSTCYRASGCHIEAGSYTSEPNTSFFVLDINTNAEFDSTCYRGQDCHVSAGAYSSEPNTSFFVTIHSLASGSTAYRAKDSHISGGAYTSTPNTSFFSIISSHGSGSTAYRGEDAHAAAGAYTSEPNTSFFATIHSLASGSTAYRAQSVCIGCGSYTSTPNTLFFSVISSHASGSTSYRAEDSNVTNGAYTSEPNTSFFVTIRSLSSGSTSYRGQSSHISAGAYTSAPNEMFFEVISSHASGSTSYRAEKTHITNGAYTSEPNTSFFVTIYSLASGSTAYRGNGAHISAGAYSTAPNTAFFNTISSHASGTQSFRAESTNITAGAYTSTPNTSFFVTSYSLGSGSKSYRGEGAHIDAGAYNNPPNTSFFVTIHSLASSLAVYRAQSVHIDAGAYSSTPNIAFFNVDYSLGSGSKCYRGRNCASTAVVEANLNTLFFVYNYSLSSGSTCYRSSACREEVGAYSSAPNTSFFNILSSTNAEQDSTCYRGQDCHIEAGAYTSTPNTSYFITISSMSSGSTAYRAQSVNISAGAYSSEPNTMFFIVVHSLASGSTSYRAEAGTPQTYTSSPNTSFFITITSHASGLERYRGESAHISAGAYTSSPNKMFFEVISSQASGSTSYRAEKTHITNGAYTSTPNTSFFVTSHSLASGSTSYRAEGAHISAGSYAVVPNTAFFNTISSHASGTQSFRAESANITAGAYTSVPNTSFFVTSYSLGSGSTSYRAEKYSIDAGAYTSSPNTIFFNTISSHASGIIAYRAYEANVDAGSHAEKPSEVFFTYVSSSASGSTAYRAILINVYSSSPNTSFFEVISSSASGLVGWQASSIHYRAGAYSTAPNAAYFNTISSQASGFTSFRAESANITAGAYTSTPNTSFFVTSYSLGSGSTAYRGEGAHISAGSYVTTPNAMFFEVISSHASGTPAFRAESANITAGAYTSEPNTSFFVVDYSLGSGSTSYRGRGVHISAGSYTSSPNTTFFITISSQASGVTSYRAESVNITAGSYISSPNTVFFNTISSHASGSTAYRVSGSANGSYTSSPNTSFFEVLSSTASGLTSWIANSVHYRAGAYSTAPNTAFFITISSHASGTPAFRAESANITAGAYTSTPNTSFFVVDYSLGSGSTAYRGRGAHISAGAYASAPNTLFFNTISSYASGETCFRAESCNTTVGANKLNINAAYDESRFFIQSTSLSSGSTCYRVDACNPDYYSYPADEKSLYVLYRDKTASQHGGLICYKGTACNESTGYKDPENVNTSYFNELSSVQYDDGKFCQLGRTCHYAAGAYDNAPNTSFFVTSSETSGENNTKTCYRAEGCNIDAGAYSTAPNTAFFTFNQKDASGSTCYRATGCTPDSAYVKDVIDESFFVTSNSLSSGLECFRAELCNTTVGSYSSEPNTSFFMPNKDTKSGLTCYRADGGCHISAGSYSSTPNTSFFMNVATSSASGYTCYRGTECNTANFATTTMPDGSYFEYDSSKASGSTCYRVTDCASTVHNVTDLGGFMGSTVLFRANYRSENANQVRCAKITCETGFYSNTVNYKDGSGNNIVKTGMNSSGQYSGNVRCYWADSCNADIGYAEGSDDNTSFVDSLYFSAPNSSFYSFSKYHPNTDTRSTLLCQKVPGCASGASTEAINELYFTVGSKSYRTNGYLNTCYRAFGCTNTSEFSLDEEHADTAYFSFATSTATGITCYIGTSCASSAYSFIPNTSFFKTSSKFNYGNYQYRTCYRGDGCNIDAGAYSSSPNTTFFKVGSSKASGSTCFRASGCSSTATATKPDEIFFQVVSSKASGKTCFRASGCQPSNGSFEFSSNINSSLFKVDTITAPGKTCYYGGSCNTDYAGVYSTGIDTTVFTTATAEYSPALRIYCYRAECNTSNGYMPNTSLYEWFTYRTTDGTSLFQHNFNPSNSKNNFVCYEVNGCNATSGFSVDTSTFNRYNTSGLTTTGYNTSYLTVGRTTCYKASSCTDNYNYVEHMTASPNSTYFDHGKFKYDISKAPHWAEKFYCAYAVGCVTNISSETVPDTLFFNTSSYEAYKSSTSKLKCYFGSSCASTATASRPSTVFFNVQSKTLSTTCYRATSCNKEKGSYPRGEAPEGSLPGMFTMEPVGATGVVCNYMTGCGEGFYSSSPNTSFFITDSATAGSHTCHYSKGCNEDADAFSSKPSATYFQTISSHASGKECFRATRCSTSASTEEPDSKYFEYGSSYAGFSCYRATGCKPNNGSYESLSNVNTVLFNTSSLYATPKTCYFGTSCKTNTPGVYQVGTKTVDPTVFFVNTSAQAPNGTACAKAVCNTTSNYVPSTNTEWFSYKTSDGTSLFQYNFNSGSSNNFVCYKVNDCNTTSNFIVNTSILSSYNTSGYSTAGYNVNSQTLGNITCYKSTSCTTGYNYVDIRSTMPSPSSSYFASGYFKYHIDGRPRWKDSFICAYATGCNTDTAGTSYFSDYHTATEYTAKGENSKTIKCYGDIGCATGAYDKETLADPGNPCKYNSSTDSRCCVFLNVSGREGDRTSCVDISSDFKTLVGKTCVKPKCSIASTQYGTYSTGCEDERYFNQTYTNKRYSYRNTSFFTLSGNLVQEYKYDGKTLKCLTAAPEDQIKKCAVQSTMLSGNVVKTAYQDYGDYKYYTYDANNSATCGDVTAHLANGCNSAQLSYNNNYVSLEKVTITDDSDDPVTSTDAEVSSYQDIFTVATPAQSGLSDTDCTTCYVACGCNTANGWSSTQPSGAYHKAVSSIKYNYEITSVNGKSTSSTGTKDLISEGTSRAYSASTTATGDTYTVASSSNFAPTCYKSTNLCDDDEFYSKDKIVNEFEYGDMDGNGVDDCDDVNNCLQYNIDDNCQAMENIAKLKGCSSPMNCVHSPEMICILPKGPSCEDGETCHELPNSSLNITITKETGNGYCNDVTCKNGFVKYTQSTKPSDCSAHNADTGTDTKLYEVSCSDSSRYGYALKFEESNDIVYCLNDTNCPSGSTFYDISMGLNYRCDYDDETVAAPYIRTSDNVKNVTVTATGSATYGSKSYTVSGKVEDGVSTNIDPGFASVSLSSSTYLTPKFTSLDVKYEDKNGIFHDIDLSKQDQFYIPEEKLCFRKKETEVSTEQAIALEVPTISLPYCHVNSYFGALACSVNIHFETDQRTPLLKANGTESNKSSYTAVDMGRFNLSPNVSEPQFEDNVFYKSSDVRGLIYGLVEFQKRYTVRTYLSTLEWSSSNDYQGLVLIATIKDNSAYKYAYIYVENYNGNTYVCGSERDDNAPTDTFCQGIESRIESKLGISQFDYVWSGGYLSPDNEVYGTKVEKIGLYHLGFDALGPSLFNLATSTIGSDGKYQISYDYSNPVEANAVAKSTCYNSSTWYGGTGAEMSFKHGIKSDGATASCFDGYIPYEDLPEDFFYNFTYTYYCTDSNCYGLCAKATGCNGDYGYYSNIMELNLEPIDGGTTQLIDSIGINVEEISSGDITCKKASCDESVGYYDECTENKCVTRQATLFNSNPDGTVSNSTTKYCYLNTTPSVTCSSYSIDSLMCGDEKCSSSKHYVFHVDKIPSSFIAASTSVPSCYVYFNYNNGYCSYFGFDDDELQCYSNGGISSDYEYDYEGSYTIYDVWGKSLTYQTYEIGQYEAIDPDTDLGFDDDNLGVNTSIIIDQLIPVKQSYHVMCGLKC